MHAASPVNQYYKPILRISEGCAEAILQVRQDFFHPAGSVHASAYFKALDDATFYAVSSLVQDVLMRTVSFTVYFVRPVSQGQMKASGRVVHSSKNLFVAEAEMVDASNRQIARGSGTFMRSTILLSPELGYK